MPLYAQLTRAIQFAIATGRLKIGDQLPTVRQLAVELRVNANTVAKVYAELERAGVLDTRRGVGTFVGAHHFEAKIRRDHEAILRELVGGCQPLRQPLENPDRAGSEERFRCHKAIALRMIGSGVTSAMLAVYDG